jgi:hypothetical protein
MTKGIDPQLELAVLILKARALKDLDAVAQANAGKGGQAPAKEG